uniref:Phospholipid scramblase n=1 Tax=Schistocephalus solidus TaxID=70667 RepID=A0A183SB39_SCHSO
LPVPLPFVEMDDCRVFETLRNLSLAPHLLEECCEFCYQPGPTVLVDFRWDGRDGCPGCCRWVEPNFEEPQVRVGYQLEAATGAFTNCTRQMERPNAICVMLPITSTPC